MTEPLRAARDALAGTPAWLVGGVLRDRALGRDTDDIDVVVEGDVRAAARAIARAAGGVAFALSDEFGAWRVVAPRHAWQVDLTPLRGGSLEADLALRDFTVNAMAEPLAGGELVDPFGGGDDVAARRLRMVSEDAFDEDPLRTLRVARLACELGLEVDAATADAARARAAGIARVSPERVFAELKRIVAADGVLDGLALMERLGLVRMVLPELAALRGVEQSAYHHLDVHDHTMEVLGAVVELQRDPAPALGEHAAAATALLAKPIADELTRGDALRLGALLHDVAKPRTRAVTAEGRVTFIGHDREGAAMAREILGRLRASERLRSHVAALALNHLRVGFLVHERPLSRRRIHQYLVATEPVEADVTLLSVADRLATRGRNADDAIARHLQLARELLGEALARRAAGSRPPLLRGDELAAELGIAPGRQLGQLLAELEEARFAGEVATREEAIAHARAVLAAQRT